MKKFLKDKFLACVLAMGLVSSMAGVALAERCIQSGEYDGMWCELVLAIYDANGGIIECTYECMYID